MASRRRVLVVSVALFWMGSIQIEAFDVHHTFRRTLHRIGPLRRRRRTPSQTTSIATPSSSSSSTSPGETVASSTLSTTHHHATTIHNSNHNHNLWRMSSSTTSTTPPSSLESSSATATTTTSNPNTPSLPQWQSHLIDQMAVYYARALAIKCPFFRRRAADLLDSLDTVLRHHVVTHPALMGPPLAYTCVGDTCAKDFGLSLDELKAALHQDWRTDNHRGYYITGKVNTAIYRDDCLFQGPDPDMPVRGLRKYLNAASQLFHPRTSTCQLHNLTVQTDRHVVVATWTMKGQLRLPWKPWIPQVSGRTTYHTDTNGLICRHEEVWDISAWRAFLETLCPQLARLVWDIPSGTTTDDE